MTSKPARITGVSVIHDTLSIPAVGVVLNADIAVPESARGVVLFAHGSGSSRHSVRNRSVAGELQRAGLATVLADLLTPDEERVDARTGRLRFDISLLATRVIALTDGVAHRDETARLPTGLFGASTGAAAALVAAAERPGIIAAVVSRGGRPDLAGEYLRMVRQPTLLIVGGLDDIVIDLNRQAMTQLAGETRLEIVPGATHLFEEPGTLRQVANLARDWFIRHLGRVPPDKLA
ncbi:MAG: putative phosphoribosyl transferase [Actinomycetota bacterium]|nr:putative phosphoribosyl transferase [Actinomycetota bacterium]